MNTKRLKRLINLLEAAINDPAISIDMRLWRLDFGDDDECLFCALGLATMDHEFNKEGLVFDKLGEEPRYKKFTDYDAAREFFDITDLEVQWIFCPIYYHEEGDPLVVIEHINDVLEGKAEELYNSFFNKDE